MGISEKYVNYVVSTMSTEYTVEMAACALIEELLEFAETDTDEEKLDEFGDILYQLVVFTTAIDVANMSCAKYIEKCPCKMFTYITRITSQFKKKATRDIPVDIEVVYENLCNIYSLITDVQKELPYTWQQIEEYNMKKLDKRYGICRV